MFTGLVECMGRIALRTGSTLAVTPHLALDNPIPGESIAINGCCLTLERHEGGTLFFHALAETLSRTNLGTLPVGSRVNMERAMRVDDRFGGHMVTGHVDCTARVIRTGLVDDGDFEMQIELPEEIAMEIVFKGSVAVDGVSLTVCRRESDRFAVRLIPETLARTALEDRSGGWVNLEGDVLAKYVRAMLAPTIGTGKPITMERLAEEGFL
ncbi:MAG: riboflavin synthase [Victivallaceae bacterium]|nr:riboflavin synthase [Victivallaceae bacterium]